MRTAPARTHSLIIGTALLVDADADTRMLYRTVLEPLAESVVEAEDGAEALGKAICERPSLILTETMLRRVDGFALCSLLRRDPATRQARIVVVTAAAAAPDTARAVNAGADAVLVKPCDLDEMVATIRELCRPVRGALPQALDRAADRSTGPRRLARSRTFQRVLTTTPPAAPPHLLCPACAAPLAYVNSHVGGVSDRHAEQWDYYTCPRCGTYRYRHRTRKLALDDPHGGSLRRRTGN